MGCKSCSDVTLLSGNDGNGIQTIVDNGNNTFTIFLTDGTNQTISFIPPAKIAEYYQNIQTIDISTTSATPDAYAFPNANYQALQYTNTSGVTKKFLVTASFDTITDATKGNQSVNSNWVDGAIIKTVSGTDTIEYESLSQTNMAVNLYDGAAMVDVVQISSADPVKTVAGNNTEVRYGLNMNPKQMSIFKKITLNNNESVSLKFKTKDASVRAYITKGQLLVKEI